MKVALVQCPVWWTQDPPLGLAQIAGCVEHAGHKAQVFDLNILLWRGRTPKYENMWLWEQSHFWNDPQIVRQFYEDNEPLIAETLTAILRGDAKVVGFSVCLGSHWATLELARRIKQEDPSRIVVCGGQFFFKGDEACEWVRRPEIDAVVRGPGDIVFPKLLHAIAKTGRPSPLPGVVCKVQGKLADGGPAPAIRSLDDVPFSRLQGFPLDLYADPSRIPFTASRGCVWKCRYCSATQFWPSYSFMSGERIFTEILYHKKLHPKKRHLDFFDIVGNGNIESLTRFCELDPQQWRPSLGWKINAIIRPDMTRAVVELFKRGGCHEIIYGIESGSQAILKRMNKPFRLDVAERVLRDTHEAGIRTVANFMVGFPGESEADFDKTLAFLRRNARWLDQVYCSATFTSLENPSYLADHLKEFGVKHNPGQPPHNLYWESEAGDNDYEIRLGRHQRFRKLGIDLKIDTYKGVNGALEQDHLINLAQYKQHLGDHIAAIDLYLKYLELDLYNSPIRAALTAYQECLTALEQTQRMLEKINHVLEPKPARRQEFIAWAAPHIRDGGRLPDDAATPSEWRTEARLLTSACQRLGRMPKDHPVGVRTDGTRFYAAWQGRRVPDAAPLRTLQARVALALHLATREIARGEDQRAPASCRR